MADLMTGSCTYRGLMEKYGDFYAPLVKIEIDGTDLVEKLNLSVLMIKVTLSLEAAGMVVFQLGDLYDAEKHAFDSKVKKYFILGSIVEIELGYRSSSVSVFKGFIAMVGAEFGKTPLLTITLMDVRRLMMLHEGGYILHEVANYSDAFKAVMGKYSKLCSLEVDATDDGLEQPVLQMQSDYVFVTQELIKNRKVDREFFVLGGKAYFRKPGKVKEPIITLQYGRELLALRVEEQYQDLKIEVTGYNASEQSVIKGNATVGKNSSQKKLMAQEQVLVLADPFADTQKKATAKAKAAAGEKKWKARTGKGIAIGIPEIVPGRFVSVEELEKDYGDHKYYIKSVVHEINRENFQTIFEIGGWD